MVAPITTLRSVQVGVEATRGTLLPATSILDYTEANIKRDPQIAHIRTGGSLATSHRDIALHEVVEITVKGRCTYNWLPWWYNLFLGPLSTGTGAGADKLWTFGSAVVSDTTDNLKSASVEIGGKDTWPAEFKVSGVVGKKLVLAMDVNANEGAWTYEATLLGTAVTQGTKTGALSVLTGLTDVLVQNTKVYLNSSGTAFGATQKSGSVISAEVTIEVGMTQRFTLTGSPAATRTALTGPRNITGKFVAEWDTITDYTSLYATTDQRLRLEATGAVLGSSTYKSNLDIPCSMDTLDFGDDGGVITEEIAFTAQYDTTPGADINAAVTNATAALPQVASSISLTVDEAALARVRSHLSQWTGAGLQVKLANASKAGANALRPVLRDAAPVAGRGGAPKSPPRNLRGSIRVSRSKSDRTAFAVGPMGSRAFHRYWVVGGTRTHTISARSSHGLSTPYGVFRRVHHGARANPFVALVGRSHRGLVSQAMLQSLQREKWK